MHYYKFNIGDWNLSTGHLSLEEESIYLRLINYYYDTEGPIPLETKSVFRRLRIANHSVIANEILEEYFEKTEKGFCHARCTKEIKDFKKKTQTNRINGAKGGRPRKDATSSKTQSVSDGIQSANPEGTQTEPTNNPKQEPLTTNHKPKNKDLDFSSWPEKPSKEVLQEWLDLRKRKKAKVTKIVMSRIGKQLTLAKQNGHSVDDCLSECIVRNWTGFEADWMGDKKSQPQHPHTPPELDLI